MLKRWLEKVRLVNHFDKKFSLNEDVYLVKGAKRSALYDLATGVTTQEPEAGIQESE